MHPPRPQPRRTTPTALERLHAFLGSRKLTARQGLELIAEWVELQEKWWSTPSLPGASRPIDFDAFLARLAAAIPPPSLDPVPAVPAPAPAARPQSRTPPQPQTQSQARTPPMPVPTQPQPQPQPRPPVRPPQAASSSPAGHPPAVAPAVAPAVVETWRRGVREDPTGPGTNGKRSAPSTQAAASSNAPSTAVPALPEGPITIRLAPEDVEAFDRALSEKCAPEAFDPSDPRYLIEPTSFPVELPGDADPTGWSAILCVVASQPSPFARLRLESPLPARIASPGSIRGSILGETSVTIPGSGRRIVALIRSSEEGEDDDGYGDVPVFPCETDDDARFLPSRG